MKVIMEKVYKLRFNDNVYLYGFNNISKMAYSRMMELGFTVKGIIDQAAYQKQGNFRIISVDELKKENLMNSICILCLNNGLSHDMVAQKMYLHGFRRILYLPMRITENQSLEKQRKYRNNYRRFLRGNYSDVDISLYTPFNDKNRKAFIIIAEDEEETSFWCPRDILRTGSKKQYLESVANRKLIAGNIITKYSDCKIEGFKPYISLFKALELGDKEIAYEYLLFQRNNEFEREELFKDRMYLFEVYEQRFRYDMSFFLDSPAKVIWDKRGWLAVCDGLHRIYYLNYKGYDSYPVVTSNEEFELCKQYYMENWN